MGTSCSRGTLLRTSILMSFAVLPLASGSHFTAKASWPGTMRTKMTPVGTAADCCATVTDPDGGSTLDDGGSALADGLLDRAAGSVSRVTRFTRSGGAPRWGQGRRTNSPSQSFVLLVEVGGDRLCNCPQGASFSDMPCQAWLHS